MPADNPTCATCRHLMHSFYADRCGRLMLPRPVAACDEKSMGAWFPEVDIASDWCGEHAPRAEATKVGVDFGAGDDRTVICVPTLAHYVSAAADHGATVEGPVSPGDSFTVGSVTWVFRPVESPDAPR